MTDTAPQLPPTRFAEESDVPALLQMALLHADEMPHGRPSERRLLESIRWVMTSQTGRIIVSLDEAGMPAGMLALIIQQPLWSEEWQVDEVNFFVRPEHRRHRHAQALLEAAKDFAGILNLPLTANAVGKRAEGKARLMQRRLGPPIGCAFVFYPRTRGG